MRWVRFERKDHVSFGIAEEEKIVEVDGRPFEHYRNLALEVDTSCLVPLRLRAAERRSEEHDAAGDGPLTAGPDRRGERLREGEPRLRAGADHPEVRP